MPAAQAGIQDKDPTIAELLKAPTAYGNGADRQRTI